MLPQTTCFCFTYYVAPSKSASFFLKASWIRGVATGDWSWAATPIAPQLRHTPNEREQNDMFSVVTSSHADCFRFHVISPFIRGRCPRLNDLLRWTWSAAQWTSGYRPFSKQSRLSHHLFIVWERLFTTWLCCRCCCRCACSTVCLESDLQREVSRKMLHLVARG